jgi:hypothetical protein
VEVGCIVPDADPLLHNNSTYPCGDAPAWEALKVEVREGNRALLAVPRHQGSDQTIRS